MQSIPKTVKEKCRGVNGKQLALKCAPYVIFGYVFNKVSWLYGQQAGDNTLQKVLDTINGMGGAFANPFPSFMPRDLLVGVGCGIGFRMVVYYNSKVAWYQQHEHLPYPKWEPTHNPKLKPVYSISIYTNPIAHIHPHCNYKQWQYHFKQYPFHASLPRTYHAALPADKNDLS